MHIIYAVSTCSDKIYRQLYQNSPVKPAFQAQKYHRLLIEGLAANAPVDVVANPPVNKTVMDKSILRFPGETEGKARYHYIPAVRNPVLKKLVVGVETFFRTLHLCRRDSVVVVDCLNVVAALAAQAAARLRGKPCVGIVTDLPELLCMGGIILKLSDYVIRHCSHYVFLSEPMNRRLNSCGKPYVVLEGHADIQMREKVPAMDRKQTPRICMYAGGIQRECGLPTLTEGFRKARLENVRLHIYGCGNYVQELERIAAEDDRIVYGGMLLSSEVVEKEMEATLMVNPRPTHEEFVQYSFPSKTMEYMSTGTPLLTTRLPSMPEEYYSHVYFIEEETEEGIAAALEQVLSHTDEELFRKGTGAREFVLEERNNVVQAAKILKMLESSV